MYLNDFKTKKINSSKKFMQVPLKVNKVYFCYIKNGLTMTFGFFFLEVKIMPYLSMASNTLDQEGPWTKEKVQL